LVANRDIFINNSSGRSEIYLKDRIYYQVIDQQTVTTVRVHFITLMSTKNACSHYSFNV